MEPLKMDVAENLSFHHTVTECPDPAGFERHCHELYEMIYVVEGNGKYVVEGAEYPLLPGTMLLLRPYEFHYVCPRKNCTYERVVVHFNADAPIDAAASLPFLKKPDSAGSGVYFPAEKITPDIRAVCHIFEEIQSLADAGSAPRDLVATMVRTTVSELLLLLSLSSPAESSPPDGNAVSAVISYINSHLTEDLSLDDLSQKFFLSKYYLCRAFRSRTGVSIFSYVIAKRVALARKLLADGAHPSSVAETVGFHDYSAFYRAYRKHTGSSPNKK